MDSTRFDAYQTKMLGMARLRTAMMVLSTVLLLIIGYFALLMGGQLKTILNNAESTFQTLQTIAADLENANVPEILNNVNLLVTDAQATVDEAMGGVDTAVSKINELDLDTLNKAISDLAAVVEPLANLFGGRR